MQRPRRLMQIKLLNSRKSCARLPEGYATMQATLLTPPSGTQDVVPHKVDRVIDFQHAADIGHNRATRRNSEKSMKKSIA